MNNNRIHVLDEAIYARIAAGEVVVNPAAVVKELVENSMDAGARAITVEIEQGGKSLIRVTDNGQGIEPEDVPLAIQKHATSKIRNLEDLESIATLGFRGEALSSMAAVSRLTISTRTQGGEEGTILAVSGGGEPEIRSAGLAEGTTVKVENLFYNIPARKKFLKNTARETTNVTSVVTKLIFANPHIAIKYISNGKVVFHSPGNGKLKDALVAVYGKDIAAKIAETEWNHGDIRISGYISVPAFLYKSTHYICLFLNGRLIQSRSMQAAILRGYGERLLRGHYPFAVLQLHIPFSMADVNVHPNKLQVMLYEEPEVLDAVEKAVRASLELHNAPPVLQLAEEESGQPREAAEQPQPPAPAWEDMEFRSAQKLYEKRPAKVAQSVDRMMSQSKAPAAVEFSALMEEVQEFHRETSEQIEIADVRRLCDYRLIGQAWNTFLIVESGENLYLIDQHAAHERINFERMKREASSGGVAAQMLLTPYVSSFSSEDYELLESQREALNGLGFEYEEFGPLTLKMTAMPAQVNSSSAGRLIEDVLYELRNHRGDMLLLREQIIRASCRYSIKAGYQLSDEQIAELMEEITELDAIPHCPHGRPIAVVLTKDDLKKGFKRIV